MIELFKTKYLLPTKDLRYLSLLLAISEKPSNSQKAIGEIANLSSSMVNNYIKDFTKEGLVTVSGDTNRTKSYHVTEAGHEMLSASLLEYSAEIVQFYSSVKREIKRILNRLYSDGIKRIVLYGAADTAEIIYSALKDSPLVVTGVFDNDPTKQGNKFNGFTVSAPEEMNNLAFDAVLIASFGKQEEIYQYIRQITEGKIIIKRLHDL